MKDTMKSIVAISMPVLVMGAIFNVTILKEFKKAKTLEAQKLARIALENTNRAPAVVAVNK